MKNIAIIGNSAAGISAAEAIRKADKSVKISLLSEEQYPAYARFKLAEMLLNNGNTEKLFLKSNEFYKQENIDFLPNRKVERVIAKKNSIILFDKTKIIYDALVVASGCSANISKDVKGTNKHGVLGFRNVRNVQDILELIPISNTVCIWGSGLAAINAAYALSKKNLEIKIITSCEHVLKGILDDKKAHHLENLLREKGIEIIFKKRIIEIFGNGDVKAIKLDSGKVIGCGILILDKCLTPNTKFLENTEVNVGFGVLTDEFLRTSVENIFAAGDVLSRRETAQQHFDLPYSWDIAAKQGRIAGENAIKFLRSKADQMSSYSEDIHNGQNAGLRIFDLNFEPAPIAKIADESSDLANCKQEDI